MSKFKISKKPKKLILFFSLILILSLTFRIVLAENISGNNVIVESGETLEKTSFLSGNSVRVDGDINATTFIAGGNIEVNGDIDGDLFVAGQNVIINGEISGSLFTASQNVVVNGLVENNIYSAGASLKVKSKTNGSAFFAGQNINIEDGTEIARDVFIGGSQVNQNGIIDGDVFSSSDTLYVGGIIGGDLNYSSQNQAEFSNDSEVKGEITWDKIETDPASRKSMFTLSLLYRILFSVLASLIVWLFIRLIKPTFWVNLAGAISTSPLKALGFGFLALILTPIILVLLMVTIIGIPLSIIFLSLYIISLYISKIIVSTFIGFWFQKKFNLSNGQTIGLFILGLIILSILGIIPIIGRILRLVVFSFGLGSILLYINNNRKKTSVNNN